ncbi:hypothetical protein A6770_08235 [Nostoc minutum NIES-26]|uniref:Uncharacterized protein n=1 Tax=Nostoc minutum NIES-26 TaxID=1844469 RepID=A0A367S2F5_9NOSO|nr:hypothetical protein A6770_08235 [Nostoc minutum NIES-26]
MIKISLNQSENPQKLIEKLSSFKKLVNIALCNKKKTKIFQSLKQAEDQDVNLGINIGFAIACKPICNYQQA